jgi:hypothetical protein
MNLTKILLIAFLAVSFCASAALALTSYQKYDARKTRVKVLLASLRAGQATPAQKDKLLDDLACLALGLGAVEGE